MKILKRTAAAVMITAACICAILFFNEAANSRVVLTKYTFRHPEVPEGFEGYKILQVSDLHEAPFAEQIFGYVQSEKPDIVVITGDMAQLPDSRIDETIKLAAMIEDIPVYAVSGNHETQGGKYNHIIKELWEGNIIPLDNDSVCIEKNGDTILLLGIRDPEHNYVSETQAEEICRQIESEFPDGPCFSVLLSHRANIYPQIKDTSADLILSGHLHGGIVRLPFAGGLVGPNNGNFFFPKYDYGCIKEGDSAGMIVSGGCDKNEKKKRYFNPPEVVLITLSRGEYEKP